METIPGRTFISACMIVKNESANIARCLKSITGIVDEIVIVDTGSEDNTVSIAEQFGARVFHHQWEDDFSLHRNQSIGYAKGDWVFIIDADEEIIDTKTKGRVDADILKEYLMSLSEEDEVVGVTVNDIQKNRTVMEFNSSRIFRRGAVHYEGIVHNAPQTKGRTSYLYPFMRILHYGYDLTPEQKEKKFQRTNGLLQKRIQNDPNDYTAMFYLAQLNAESGRDNEAALKWGEKYITARDEVRKTGDNFNQSIYFSLFRIYLHQNEPEKAKDLLQDAIKNDGMEKDLDIAFAIVEFGAYVNDSNIKLEGTRSFLDIYDEIDKNPARKGNRFIYGHTPEALAYVLYHRSLTHFVEGAKMINTLLSVLGKLPEPMRNGFLQDFQTELQQAGVPLQINFEDPDPKRKLEVVSAEIPEEAFA